MTIAWETSSPACVRIMVDARRIKISSPPRDFVYLSMGRIFCHCWTIVHFVTEVSSYFQNGSAPNLHVSSVFTRVLIDLRAQHRTHTPRPSCQHMWPRRLLLLPSEIGKLRCNEKEKKLQRTVTCLQEDQGRVGCYAVNLWRRVRISVHFGDHYRGLAGHLHPPKRFVAQGTIRMHESLVGGSKEQRKHKTRRKKKEDNKTSSTRKQCEVNQHTRLLKKYSASL